MKSPPIPNTLGEFKQFIMRGNNNVYQQIFKQGVVEQQVSIYENKILVVAKHRRVPILKIIEESRTQLSEIIDRLLINKTKEILKDVLTTKCGLGVDLILKDYHPTKEISGTFIILDQDVKNYMTG